MEKIDASGLYAYLEARDYPGLRENVRLLRFRKGETIYDTRTKHTGIFELTGGVVKLGGTSPKGEDYVYELILPGEFFGNLAVLGGDSFREFSRAITPVTIRYYEEDFFRHLRTFEPVVAEWAFTKIVFRWNKTETLLARIRSFEPRERILQLYAQLNMQIQAPGNRMFSLNKHLSQKDIADLTATTRQLVADTLK